LKISYILIREFLSDDDEIGQKMKHVFELCGEMTNYFPKTRPLCKDILQRLDLWYLKDENLNVNETIENIFGKDFEFYQKFLRKDKINDEFLTPEIYDMNAIFNDPIRNGMYSENFREISILGTGSYGIVCKAKAIKNNKFYAIKKIPLINYEKYAARERNFMKEFRNDYFVRFILAWTEQNYIEKHKFKFDSEDAIEPNHAIFNKDNKLLLHIQMELCDTTLKEFLSRINRELNQHLNFQTSIGFYISCEIFKEILEAVNYLHKQEPPIIHRDLNPSNILIKYRKNGRFIKIGDFGLAKILEHTIRFHTHHIGTSKYMAPEINHDTSKYDTKVDIYSLGALSQSIFNIDPNDEER
jgi:hypothetical protein